MTYKRTIYAILMSALLVVGCQGETSAPAAAQGDNGGDDKLRIQLNLGDTGSVDIEKNDKASN